MILLLPVSFTCSSLPFLLHLLTILKSVYSGLFILYGYTLYLTPFVPDIYFWQTSWSAPQFVVQSSHAAPSSREYERTRVLCWACSSIGPVLTDCIFHTRSPRGELKGQRIHTFNSLKSSPCLHEYVIRNISPGCCQYIHCLAFLRIYDYTSPSKIQT